nr:immunoglobulin heavy chain junction region [Mus musculus]MBK4196691.1 immunoglobulin heavy chain junction region [Mus musculus]
CTRDYDEVYAMDYW